MFEYFSPSYHEYRGASLKTTHLCPSQSSVGFSSSWAENGLQGMLGLVPFGQFTHLSNHSKTKHLSVNKNVYYRNMSAYFSYLHD
jgi:hypothetical protein